MAEYIDFKKLSPNATIPIQKDPYQYNIYSHILHNINPQHSVDYDTEIEINISSNYQLKVVSHPNEVVSNLFAIGLPIKKLTFKLLNLSTITRTIYPGQLIAVLIIEPNTISYELPTLKPQIKCKKLVPNAIIPAKGTPVAAGWDLYTTEEVRIPAKTKAIIPTGIAVEIPMNDCYGRIAPRSGLAVKNAFDVLAGVVDIDYRGEIKVIGFNHGDVELVFKVGDKVAQLIFEKIYDVNLVEADKLNDTERGVSGFGSTDKK